MSIQFNDPINEESKELIKKIFGESIKVMDEKNILLEKINEIQQLDMAKIAKTAKQPAILNIHENNDIVKMSNGTEYQVIQDGWKRIKENIDRNKKVIRKITVPSNSKHCGEIIKAIIDRIKHNISDAKRAREPLDERSFGMEWGVLLSINEAQAIIDALSDSTTLESKRPEYPGI